MNMTSDEIEKQIINKIKKPYLKKLHESLPWMEDILDDELMEEFNEQSFELVKTIIITSTMESIQNNINSQIKLLTTFKFNKN